MPYLSSARSTLGAKFTKSLEGLSHIIPDVLYPAVANVMLDGSTALSAVTTGPNGSTVTSSKYGTVQSDGKMYYYTTIKGSQPIKDPRVGAHFGSQRHKFKSTQLLEQETATHGPAGIPGIVCSIDGREWCRTNVTGTFVKNGAESINLEISGGQTGGGWIEFTGYFNAFNVINSYDGGSRPISVVVDGVTAQSALGISAAVATPLKGRYLDSGSVINCDITSASSLSSNTLLGIHTVRFQRTSETSFISGIELIAQDTTSTATKSQIQIPSQRVISFGKKFTVSGNPHYDPFNGFVNSTSLHSQFVDVGTSIGLSTPIALHGAPWAISSSNNIRPYNGGRVVKWVDHNGTIKTSVNMMPPNAQNVSATAPGEITTPSATNVYLPAMSNDAIDNSLAEVAKTYNFREFGNGGANYNGSFTDLSSKVYTNNTLNTAYVMDDGLTSFAGHSYITAADQLSWGAGSQYVYFTFIGTGFSKNSSDSNTTFVQNLPYGTHIVKVNMNASATWYSEVTVDGVSLGATLSASYHSFKEINIHQPKMPPIPEDAVVLADYMLMADFVSIPDNTAGDAGKLGKGVRRVYASRDVFYDSGASISFDISFQDDQEAAKMRIYNNNSSTVGSLPYFGTSPTIRAGCSTDRSAQNQFKVNGTLVTTSSSGTNHSGTQVLNSWTSGSNGFSADNDGSFTLIPASGTEPGWATVTGITLGQNTVAINNTTSTYLLFHAFDIASPIHTSSHYQTFETPYLHELVGGDRNMEQTNLVVTPDGKTWDEVTRNTSYIGSVVLSVGLDTTSTATNALIQDEWRGTSFGDPQPFGNKDFAIAYDRQICLKTGQYGIHCFTIASGNNRSEAHAQIYINGAKHTQGQTGENGYSQTSENIAVYLTRGDYVQTYGEWTGSTTPYSGYWIERI